ncbi:unnamed protein product [Cladocopium goreaui]|uniref:RNase H type-1 domain-containing protein n=1 Tax=Cladocopium goreaui TaxID=2562237 RepID=A0A9P1FU94_9DINO|nr:unnamed protein product [Cladocopium goreaui]
MPQQTGPSHPAVAREDLDYDDYEAASMQDVTPSHGSSSVAPRPEEEVGVHIFRLERPDGHCFLRWSSYRRILFDLTRCLLMRRNDVVGIHPMIVPPIGLQEPHEKAVILQSRVDLLPGSREQLVLIDLEVHFHALPDGLLIPPAVTRKVYRVLPPVHRSQILILLGLFDYCELHGDHCTIFQDHLIWHLEDRTLHDLPHGTYVRVIVPPPADTTLDTQRAIAISRDFALEAHRPHHRPDCQAQGSQSWRPERLDDHSTFFQLDVQACPPLPAQYKVAPDQVVQPALLGTSAGGDLPLRAPRPSTRFHDRDFETLQNLFQSLSLIECEEEGQVAYVDTWYVHHAQHSRCTDSRAVKLYQDPASWLEDLIAPWEDIIDETIDIVLYLVRPTPPCTTMECLLAHIIIEQAPRPDMVVGLISTHDSNHQSALIDHTAWSLPSLITANSIIRMAEHQVECRFRRCTVRRGPLPFDPFDFDEIEPGVGLVIYLHPANTGWLGPVQSEESDQGSLLQTHGRLPPALDGIDVPHNDPHQSRSENFAFNPSAKRFCPGSLSHSLTSANVQELQDLWRRSAFSWEGEEVVINVVTWLVDQFHQALHSCWRPRLVRLQGEAQSWERQLRLAWNDLQLPGAPILIHVVQPSPPSRDQQVAAHLLLIQNPLDGVSSSLLTVFDTERDLSGPTMQFALTTRDTLALDDIINDLGLSARCLSPNAPSICGAWIGTQLLVLGRPLPLGDGSGILFQVSRRPTNQDIQAHLAGTNLLQISARRKEGPPSPGEVKQELSSYGISCKIALLSDDFTALVFPLDFLAGPEVHHFVYVSQTDPHEIHLHTCETGFDLDELDHMRHLYQLGFEKAVILSVIPHEVGIIEVSFTVSIGALQMPAQKAKQLPDWPQQQPRRPPGKMFIPNFKDDSALCNLHCGISGTELGAFFTSSKNTLCTFLTGLSYLRFAISEIGIPDAWCFLVLGETYTSSTSSDITLIGWSAHQVRCGKEHMWSLGADRTGSAISEREALTWAMLWRIGQNSNIPTIFRSDSMLTLQQARGVIGALQCDDSFQILRGCAQLLESALDAGGLLFDHIPGHAGDPFNEFCDHIAKVEGRKGFFLKRPKLDLATWRPIIPFLWMLFDTNSGVPSFQGRGFNVHPPDLPPVNDPRPCAQPMLRSKKVDFTISIATGNVQSLGKGEHGFAGKLAFIRSQFLALHINFLGLQETRSDEGSSYQHGVFRLSSGHLQGQGGVELWCNLRQPSAFVDRKEIYLQRKHFCVAHRDHRRILVRIQHDLWDAWALVAYTPHSGYSSSERSIWWSDTQDILSNAGIGSSSLFVCIDANAGLGDPDGFSVLHDGFCTTSGTRFLRDFMLEFQLCAPIASPVHSGSTCTWTSPIGDEFTIDYVLLPNAWQERCHRSRILEELDMGNRNVDHSAYAVELVWADHKVTGQHKYEDGNRGTSFDRSLIQSKMPVHFHGSAVASWNTDVEEHLVQINSHLHSQLRRWCPRPSKGPDRPYIDDHIWQMRKAKLHHRRQLRLLRGLLRRETMARIFSAWKEPQNWKQDGQISKGKQIALSELVQDLGPATSASEIQQRLRPFLGSTNKLRQGLSPLPLIKDAEGKPCTSNEAVLNRWIEFFSEMEGGERMTLTEQRHIWRSNLAALSQSCFTIDISEIPSLTELEQACRQVKAGKASGMDGVPSELLRYCPATMAKQFYSLLLKICLQGQEPLAHKGGFLVPIWKGKLGKDTCQAFRSILISSMVGKTLHKALRTKQTQLYQRFLHPQQLGGRKGISVILGGHLIRAFLRVFESRKQPTAVLFIDLQEAFYRVVRPLAISGEWTDEIIATMAARLQMDHHLLHDLYEHLQAPSAVESAQMSAATEFALRTAHGRAILFADVVFGYLMARVLKSFDHELEPLNILSEFPQAPTIDLQGSGLPTSGEGTDHEVPSAQRLLGPCWMDDLAIPLTANTNEELLNNLGTWCICDLKTKEYLHCAIIRLYKRLLRCPRDAHLSDEEILHRTGLPAPATLLRIRRLSYLGSLLSVGSSAHWGLLNLDNAWLDLLRDDLQWAGDQLSRSCSLGDPFSHTARWLEVIQHHRGYWKRLLRRARDHSILVASRKYICTSTHLRMRDLLLQQGRWDGPGLSHNIALDPSSFYGCLHCEVRCKTLAGEGAHMFKVHGISHPVRTLIHGTQCGACLTEYFTQGKLKAHLIRAHHCRQQLLGRKICHTPSAGLGSIVDTQRHTEWDGRLPPLQAEGPRNKLADPRDFDIEHCELFEAVSILIVESTEDTIQEFGNELRQLPSKRPISWTAWTSTFRSLITFFDAAELDATPQMCAEIRRCLLDVARPSSWSFLQADKECAQSCPSLGEMEEIFAQTQWRAPTDRVPRPCSRERIFLHVFSGRRRAGDLQFYMEKMFDSICQDGSILCVVSLDLVIDAEFGDVRRPDTQAFWKHGVAAGWVLGALCGPPCETWSQARFVEDPLHPGRGPRPLRDRDHLWGFESLSLREAQQVATGNELLLFTIELLYALACVDGFGLLEHPQEPEEPSRPSIWHLEALHLLRRCPGVQIVDFAQGLLGANSPKPTRLLALNLPDLQTHLRRHHVTPELPKRSAIGRSEDGSWRTAPLKEYPPAMNRALSHVFCNWFRRHPFCTDFTVDPKFLSRCRAMSVSAFGTTIGRDFGG